MATQKEIAEYLGLTDRTVRNLQSKGIISDKRGRNGYCLKTSIRDYIRHLEKKNKTGEETDDEATTSNVNGIDTDYQDARKAKLQADKLEIDLLVKLGEVAPIEMILELTANKAAQVASLLDTIPASVARAVPELPKSRLAVIEQEITKARNEATKPIDLESYLATCFKYGDSDSMESESIQAGGNES